MKTLSRTTYYVGAALVVAIAALGFYNIDTLRSWFKSDDVPAEVVNRDELRELRSTATYSVPEGGSHTEIFSVFVDAEQIVRDVDAREEIVVGHQEKLDIFAQTLRTMIVGKKLSELGPVDRVGGSSLTTAAFNEALGNIQAEL